MGTRQAGGWRVPTRQVVSWLVLQVRGDEHETLEHEGSQGERGNMGHLGDRGQRGQWWHPPAAVRAGV